MRRVTPILHNFTNHMSNYYYKRYKNRFPLFNGDISRRDYPVQEFTSGAYGALAVVPFIWTGSTASGRTLTLLVDAFGTYSAQSAAQNLFSTEYGVIQDGVDYSVFDFVTQNPTVDLSGAWSCGAFLYETFDGINSNVNNITSVSPSYSVYGRSFDTSSCASKTQTLNWSVAYWKIKPNVTIQISKNNPDPSNPTFVANQAYFYNGTSAVIYSYSKTQNDMIFYFA